MWTIDDAELHRRLLQPLVQRRGIDGAQPPQGKCASPVPFPWQVPFPNDEEWQAFLGALLHELRDQPAAKQAFFNAIDVLAGIAPRPGTQPGTQQ